MKIRTASLFGIAIIACTNWVANAVALTCSCNGGDATITVPESNVKESGISPEKICSLMNGSTAKVTIGLITKSVKLTGCAPKK